MTRVGELKFYATEIVFRNTVNGSCPRANTMIGYGKVSSRIGLYWIADTRRQGNTVLLRSTLQFFLYKANTRLRCARDQIMESHFSKRLFICSCFGLPKQRKNTGVNAFRLRRVKKKKVLFSRIAIPLILSLLFAFVLLLLTGKYPAGDAWRFYYGRISTVAPIFKVKSKKGRNWSQGGWDHSFHSQILLPKCTQSPSWRYSAVSSPGSIRYRPPSCYSLPFAGSRQQRDFFFVLLHIIMYFQSLFFSNAVETVAGFSIC